MGASVTALVSGGWWQPLDVIDDILNSSGLIIYDFGIGYV